MTNAKKLSVFASLFLGATMIGGMSAGAAPFSNAATSVQPELRSKTLVEKTGKRTRNLLLGLGAGALIGGAIIHNNNNYNRRRYNNNYYRSRPVRRRYSPGYQPWSDAWYDYCYNRYRSFNPNTGYFKSYSGRYVFCR